MMRAGTKHQLSVVSYQLAVISLLFTAVLILSCPMIDRAAEAKGDLLSGMDKTEVLRLGERIYREGILPDNKPLAGFVSGDVPVSGASFTCVSCHLRSGLGSLEGKVVTPPANGRVLYEPRETYIKGSEYVPYIHNYSVYLPTRPAYTDETLAALISTGFDPTGRSVVGVMPRYEMSERDMAILIAYLKSLSDKPSPGVDKSVIRFATVIVEGSDPLEVKSMLTPLQFSVDRKNSLAVAAQNSRKVSIMSYNMVGGLTGVKFSLSQWTLGGPSSTWRQQLEDYYKAEPVFALLGGISNVDWEPVHRFCEENQIPNLMPVADYPIISQTDWYTLYPSRGIAQEGEAAARYLGGMHELFKGRPVIQLIRAGRRAEALADGFRRTWKQAGHTPAEEITLSEGEQLTAERLQQIVSQKRPAALLIWDDASFLNGLKGLAGKPDQPGLVISSGTYMGKALWAVPEELRDMLYMTYPYRLPHEEARYDNAVRKVLSGKPLDSFDQGILRQSYIASELLGKALLEMRGEYYRDFLLDTIGMMADQYYPLFERVSFGPGQRYASKGCFIVQLGKGDSPRLERRSEWVTQ